MSIGILSREKKKVAKLTSTTSVSVRGLVESCHLRSRRAGSDIQWRHELYCNNILAFSLYWSIVILTLLAYSIGGVSIKHYIIKLGRAHIFETLYNGEGHNFLAKLSSQLSLHTPTPPPPNPLIKNTENLPDCTVLVRLEYFTILFYNFSSRI